MTKTTQFRQRGFVLITVLMLLLLFTAAGLATLYSVQANIKSAGNLRLDSELFYGADGGAVSVLGYMTAYKTTSVPKPVREKDEFKVEVKVLKQSVRLPPGFSTLWKGADVVENSFAPNPDVDPPAKSQVEVVAFIPTSPAGYGNE